METEIIEVGKYFSYIVEKNDFEFDFILRIYDQNYMEIFKCLIKYDTLKYHLKSNLDKELLKESFFKFLKEDAFKEFVKRRENN